MMNPVVYRTSGMSPGAPHLTVSIFRLSHWFVLGRQTAMSAMPSPL